MISKVSIKLLSSFLEDCPVLLFFANNHISFPILLNIYFLSLLAWLNYEVYVLITNCYIYLSIDFIASKISGDFFIYFFIV